MKFKSLEFSISQNAKTEDEELIVSFYGSFQFNIPLNEVKRIDKHFKLNPKNNHEVVFSINKEKAEKKFMFLIQRFMSELKSKITGNKTIYLHEYSNIPLHGLQFIGIVDKGTDMVEIKPLTSCLMNCGFCSVGEGLKTRKQVDFVVEEEYLVEELNALLDFKKKHAKSNKTKISVWINPHGEPLLYSRILDLMQDVSKIDTVKDVHLITSGTLLNKDILDKISNIKKAKLSVSISAISEKTAKKIMGVKAYDSDFVLEMIEYASKKGIETTITPVYLHNINDKDIGELIQFSKKNKIKILIQKFCTNKFGRNPIKETNWDDFSKMLKKWGVEYGLNLLQTGEIGKSEEFSKPFKKGDVVQAEIVSPGRYLRDKIAIAQDRCILIPNCKKNSGRAKVKITTAKFGMYLGSC
jgi:uncharacterized protein